MKKLAILVYGAVVYALFLAVFLYAIGFVMGIGVPKDIDDGAARPIGVTIAVDALLLGLFGIQHSIMARRGFKRWWTRVIPRAAERSTFVLATNIVLAVIFWKWQPITTEVWSVDSEPLALAITGLAWAGWAIVLLSTFLIDHFELFGLRQSIAAFRGTTPKAPRFQVAWLYRWVRHPLLLGFLIAFWSAPTMTGGRLLFAATVTAYILVAVRLEERDLIAAHGDDYLAYRRRVPMLLPVRRPADRVEPQVVSVARG